MEVSATHGSDGMPVVMDASSPGDISCSVGVESIASSKKKKHDSFHSQD